jgi:Na+/phosphate symporter
VLCSYKHAIDGLWQVVSKEGPTKLMSGATMASSRATLVTIGQLSFYDQIKQVLVVSGIFGDNVYTHFTASFLAVSSNTRPWLVLLKYLVGNIVPSDMCCDREALLPSLQCHSMS